ncbi:MAG TPA: stalk domain-containing protein, partial [Exilispira sp.]|nr:stalk domain-containing protein [Exilispira sp.]
MTKEAFNSDNYDLTYGIENYLHIKAYPADKRDLAVKTGIFAYVIGKIEIWAQDKFIYNEKHETMVDLKVLPRGIGAKVADLLTEILFNEDFEDCFAKINFFNQYETLFWLYDLSEPDFNLKNRNFNLLKNYPKILTTSKISNWNLPIFDAAKGLEIIYEFDNPPTVFMETTLIVKVVERGPKFPASGVDISVYGSGIDLVSITDSDGFAKFKIEPTEIEEIIIVAKKKDYVIDRKEIEVKDNENILPSKPENVKVEISKEVGVKIEWSPSIPGTNPIGGYEIWKGKNEQTFSLLDIVESGISSYIDRNIKFGEKYFYKLRTFDTGVPKNYSEFSDIVSIDLEDIIPPIFNIISPQDNFYTNKDTVTIKGIVSDSLSGVDKLKINEEDITFNENWEFEKEVTIIQGENKIKIEAIDRAGNKIEKILTVYLDNIPPEILVSLPNEVYDSMLSIDGKIKDDLSGIESLKINGVNVNISSNSSFTYSLSLYEGDNKIKFEAVDKAGNKTTKEITVKYIKRIVLKLQIGNKNMYVNDEQVDIDVSPTIIEGRTYLPIRWVAEPLGAEVEWDGNERKVTITFKDKII